MTTRDFLFNFTFTRPDENDATEYAVGMHVNAATYEDAEQSLRRRNAHLTIRKVTLFAVFTEDGDRIYPAVEVTDECEHGACNP